MAQPIMMEQPVVVKRPSATLPLAVNQCCAKLVGFEANIGFEIEISQKYRYRIDIGYEIARIWTSILILFRNFELIDIGFDIGFELLHVGILHQLRANL